MGIFPSLIEKRSAYDALNDFWYSPIVQGTEAGVRVDEKTALKYLTVYACVTLIAGDIARLPLNLYKRKKSGGKEIITDHALFDLLHNAPNEEMTSFNWREAAQGHLLLWGNHYSYIERDKKGSIRALWPLPDPGVVAVKREGKKLIYEYKKENNLVKRDRYEIFHIPGYGFNGLMGMSMIGAAREAIGMGMAMEMFGSKYFGEGTHPGGLLTLPPEVDLGENEKEYREALKQQYSGLGKSHSIMLLQNGETYAPLTVPLNDAQFLESRDHQKIEICGLYHVPPHKIAIHGQNSNYNNLEQENASYVDSCLMHWLVRWESAISSQLLTEQERRSGMFFEFLVQGLLRGDSQARADYYNKLFQVAAMTPNEIRAKENMNPIKGGDESFVMLNMVPLDQAGEVPEPQAPAKQPPDPNNPDDLEAAKEVEKAFWSGGEVRMLRDERSIRMRDRVARRYRPLILDAAKAIVSRETKAIKARLVGRQGRAEADAVVTFLEDFYKKFPEYINRKMGPVLRSFIQAIADETMTEIGVDGIDIDSETQAFIARYVERHIESSQGQMVALLEGGIDALSERADEWQETRPDKIATNETSRASNAAFAFVAFAAGMSLVWRTRGPKTCPYCMELNGRRVSQGESFVESGQEIDPASGTGPMKVYGMKTHPPLHQGCDCYISAG